MTVVRLHPDSAPMERHLDIAAQEFRTSEGLTTMKHIDVCGSSPAGLLERLRRQAGMPGAAVVPAHPFRAGSTRTAPR